MKIVKAGYEILTPISEAGIKELQHIEKISRVCYKSEDLITDDGESAKKMVNMLIKRDHTAMIEHSSLSVKFIVDRGISHELVRHRIASFAQESTRYVSYSNKPNEINTEDEILNSYNNGMSMKKISERSKGKYTEWEVYKILENNDVSKRNLGSRGIINEKFFDKIDSPEKAYLLGFIQADGSIRRDLSQLCISQKDDEQWWILNMIRDFVQPDAKTLNIHNKTICTDLCNKGIIPNKTYECDEETEETLWNSVPYEYKYDFLRGLMDGDGNIRWFYQTDNSKTMSCNIGFTNNKYLIRIISNFLLSEFDYNTNLQLADNYARIYITDSKIGKMVCKKMYKNFIFPYGHSKTCRYYEAFGISIPYKKDNIATHDFNVVIPTYFTKSTEQNNSGKCLWVWGQSMLDSEICYKNLIDNGATPQEARSVLPNSTKTEITVTANYREWRSFLKLRTTKAAHPQMVEVTVPLLKELKEKLPIIFDDIEVEE